MDALAIVIVIMAWLAFGTWATQMVYNTLRRAFTGKRPR